jgi:putative ABC transport system permease protein
LKLRLVTDFVLRESRGSRARLFFFTLCLAVGVSAVVGVAGITDAIRDSIEHKSRQLLASDLRVSSSFELPGELNFVLKEQASARSAEVRELKSMVSVDRDAPGNSGNPTTSQLAEIKAIESGYPFYGELQTAPPNGRSKLDSFSALAGPGLFAALSITVGDSISIGGASFKMIGEVVDEPDQLNFSMALGPRVFISIKGLERTNLIQFGSRVRHRTLFALPDQSPADIQALADRIRAEVPDSQNLRVETRESAQAQISESIERVEGFLGLVALLSLVLGGIGVAQISRAWIAERTADIAVRRALGFRPREILVLYIAQVLVLSSIGSLIGALAGASLPFFAPILAPEFLEDVVLTPWQPMALLTGLALGVLIALVFSIPPLTAVWRISPARVLRAEAEPLSAPRFVQAGSYFIILLGVFGCAFFQSQDVVFAASFTGGLLVMALLLALAARLITAVTARLPRQKLSPYLVQGLAALSRPGHGTAAAVVTLGLGVLIVTTLVLVDQRLEDELEGILPERAPTTFMIDIQPDQWEPVEQLLAREQADNVNSVPVVTARLTAIDGVPIYEIQEDDSEEQREGRRSWALSREQRLTWLRELPESNELLEGELWSLPDQNEVSIEEGFAEELGLKLGSVIQIDLQGVPFELTVSSLRSVDWKSFSINFFLIAEPGVFDDAPHYRVATARMTTETETRVQDLLAGEFPNVTIIKVRAIIEKVSGIMRQMAFGIRVLAGFAILVGIAVLAGAVSANGARRAREAALLKALGVTRRQVLQFFAVEYAVVGALAGFIGVGGAMVAAYFLLEQLLELEPNLSLVTPLIALAASALAATLSGLAASTKAILARPISTLSGMSGGTN